MKFTTKHLELLIHYSDNHVARLAQLSATKQKTFLELAASGCMIEDFVQDPFDPLIYTDVKYIHITEKGRNLLAHTIDAAQDYLTSAG